MNHGDYEERDAEGRLILKGQFDQGLKTGVWTQFNEKGQKTAERYFEKNVETSARPAGGPQVR